MCETLKGGEKLTSYDKQKFADEINQITSRLSEILQSKNADYGNNVDKSIDKWGLPSLAQRLDDKYSRFENLIKEGNVRQVSDETIEDTLLDIAGYAILGYRKISEMNQDGLVVAVEESKNILSQMPLPKFDIDRKPVQIVQPKPTFTFSE